MPPTKKNPKKPANAHVVDKTSLESFLLGIRDICRNKGAQMDENGNIYADLVYDDLLFLKELWSLVDSGGVSMDIQSILKDTGIHHIKLDTIASLSLGDIANVNTVFNRIWSALQRSSLSSIFDREFALKSILKDEKLKGQYLPILIALLDYTGKVHLVDHEDTDPYEYFTKELKKGKSKYFGQFYTPEILTESCVNEIKPQFGEIGLDPAAGTGKFMRSASKYISKNQPEHSEWDAYQHMRMVEIENKIYRQGILGTFIKYKKLPNMANQRKGNSFDLLIKEEEKVDYILANPPYGGTVDGFDEIYYDVTSEQKGKRMVKKTTVKPEVVYPFEFVKKDTCVLFIQLCVNKLKDGGRAAVIFNATVMNDSHRDVIKWFLSKCNLYKMIVNPSGTFKCTGIETYSFIFTKGKPTEKIEYYDVVTGNKIGELTMAQIEQRGWDIRPKFDISNKEKFGIELSSIKKLFTIVKGTAKASEVEEGNYPFMTSAENKTTNIFTCDGEGLYLNIIPTGQIHQYTSKIRYYIGKCDMSSLMMRIIPISPDTVLLKYIYYYLKLQIEDFKKVYNVEMYLRIDWDKFWAYEIPTPPLPIQQEIVATLDRIFADPQDMKDCLAFTDKAMDLMLKDPSGKLLEDVMGGLRLKRSQLAIATSIKAQMAAVMRSVGARGYEKKKLGDVYSNPKTMKRFNSGERDNVGEVPFFNGKWSCPDGTHSEHSFESDSPYFVMIKDGGGDHNSETVGMGKFFNISGKCAITSHNMILSPKADNGLSHTFVYHYLCSSAKNIRDMAKYSINLGSISKDSIMGFEIPYPPIAVQQEVLTTLNEMEAELKVMEQMTAKAEQRAKYILDGYLTS